MSLAVRIITVTLVIFTATSAPAQLPGGLPTLPLIPQSAASGFDFPVYPVMFPNVRFWEKIYGIYTETQGVLHDKDDLSRIYTVINLMPKDTPGASIINEKLTETAQLHCQAILKKFATGGMPETSEELQIYSLFKQKMPAVFLAAADNMRVQTGLKNRFREGVIRSGAYMPVIKQILRMHGLPWELAYLPHVESSYNPRARSKAGAVGLWQFTSYTGTDFMTINDLVDERFDLYAASSAAAQFLKENYRQLGSWPLALTAYNHGRGGMFRAKQEWGTYPAIFTSYTGKSFGFASKNFYAEFVAAYRVARRLEKDPTLIRDQSWDSASMQLRDYASAPELIRYFGISEEEFGRLNPALLKPVLEGKRYIPRGTLIHLPATGFIRPRINTMPESLFHRNQLTDPKPEPRRQSSGKAASKKGAGRLGKKITQAPSKVTPVRNKAKRRQ